MNGKYSAAPSTIYADIMIEKTLFRTGKIMSAFLLQGILILLVLHHHQQILGRQMNENEYHHTELGRTDYNNPHQNSMNYHNPALKEMEYLNKLDRKILEKISKKKIFLDSFLALWLQILEKKKQFLFKIWEKKKSKKSKEKDFNSQNFHIPYYYEHRSDKYQH